MPSKAAVLRTWDETPHTTRNFVLETKIIDFGNLYSNKSIIGVGMNLTQATTTGISAIFIDYRRDVTEEYIPLETFISTNVVSDNPKSFRCMLSNPIRDIKTVQLRINSPYSSAGFGITDLELFYRTYRDVDTNRFDEGP